MKKIKCLIASCTAFLMLVSNSIPVFANEQIKPPQNSSIYKASGEEIRGEWTTPEDRFDEKVFLQDIIRLEGFIAEKVGLPYAGAIADFVADVIIENTMDSVYVGITKKYQEIYIAGEFAFFRTTVTTRVYSDSSFSNVIDTDVRVLEGLNPASVE